MTKINAVNALMREPPEVKGWAHVGTFRFDAKIGETRNGEETIVVSVNVYMRAFQGAIRWILGESNGNGEAGSPVRFKIAKIKGYVNGTDRPVAGAVAIYVPEWVNGRERAAIRDLVRQIADRVKADPRGNAAQEAARKGRALYHAARMAKHTESVSEARQIATEGYYLHSRERVIRKARDLANKRARAEDRVNKINREIADLASRTPTAIATQARADLRMMARRKAGAAVKGKASKGKARA